jgi:hypothetical protein
MRHSNPIIGAVMDALTPLMRWMGPDTPHLLY